MLSHLWKWVRPRHHRTADNISLSRINDTGLSSTASAQASVNPNHPSNSSLAASSTSPVRAPFSTRNLKVKCGTSTPFTLTTKGNIEMILDEDFLKNGLRDSITELTAWMKKNPTALDMVSYDFRSVPETCDIRDCESEAEFFVFDPITNEERAHVCLNCFDQVTNGASGGTAAYFARIEAVLGERDMPSTMDWDEFPNC